jgi:methionyl-tRNA synthetase
VCLHLLRTPRSPLPAGPAASLRRPTPGAQGDDTDKARAAAALVAVLEGLRVAAVLLSPVTPSLSAAIYSQLGLPAEAFESLSWRDTAWGGLPSGHPTAGPAPVFTRLDGDWVTEAAGGRDAADGKAAGKGGKQQKGKAKPKAQAGAAAEAGAAA